VGVAITVEVNVDPASGERPPAGTPVHVELRDTSLADAPARVLASAEAFVGEAGGGHLLTVELPEADADAMPSSGWTVWAHADVSETGDVTKGDYITMQSHAVPSAEQMPARVPVILRPVH